MSDIVFSEEVNTTDSRGRVVLIERESGRKEWYWSKDLPDDEPPVQHSEGRVK